MLARTLAALTSIAAALAAPPAFAADDEHTIHFAMEHVPESAMDAHYLSLPWPAESLERGEWRPSLDVSTARTRTGFIDLDGPTVAFAAARGVTRNSGYELLGFYSNADIAGSGGRAPLDPWFLDGVPLATPAAAEFTNARGTFRHYGVGAALVHERPTGRAQLIAGVLLERAEAAGFAVDYRLAAGASAGAAGVVDHSTRATFLTPFVGWQQTHALNPRWTWQPRALLACPLPPNDFRARVTGPGFDATTRRPGARLEIGDPFVGMGLAFEHEPSGVSFDVGGALFFAAAEHVSHAGVDRALLLHVAWRRSHAGPRG
jgi:hypothetical protein